ETYSECDITVAGAYEYARHPSTEILCASYVYGTRDELATAKVELWDFHDKEPDTRFMRLLTLPDTVLVAHNAFFEQVITRFVLPRYTRFLRTEKAANIPIKRWICTAALARYYGLPGTLEGATAAL